MAAPHVTGAVALLLAKNPALTAAQIAAAINGQARPLVVLAPDESGAGLLHARRAWDNV
jgi:subtilisin family serine protease